MNLWDKRKEFFSGIMNIDNIFLIKGTFIYRVGEMV